MISKEEFIAKYQHDLSGRILAGVAVAHQVKCLGEYATNVLVGSRAWLDKIYTELVPQTPVTKGKA